MRPKQKSTKLPLLAAIAAFVVMATALSAWHTTTSIFTTIWTSVSTTIRTTISTVSTTIHTTTSTIFTTTTHSTTSTAPTTSSSTSTSTLPTTLSTVSTVTTTSLLTTASTSSTTTSTTVATSSYTTTLSTTTILPPLGTPILSSGGGMPCWVCAYKGYGGTNTTSVHYFNVSTGTVWIGYFGNWTAKNTGVSKW